MAQNKKTIELDIDAKINAANAETDLRKLSRQLKDLNSELSKIGDTSSEDFIKLSEAISKVEGKIGDASDRLQTITGEPLERVSAGLGLVSEGLLNLDFDKATIGINGIADGIGKMNLSEMKEGIGKVATAFLNLGKALLSNPLFLLGASITLIVMNFEKLTKAGGVVGAFFKELNVVVTYVKDTMMDFINAIGLVNTKQEDLRLNTIALTNAQIELRKTIIEGEIAIIEAAGTSKLYLEYREKELEVDQRLRDSKKELYDELEKRPLLENIFNQKTLEEANYFAKKYGLILNDEQIKSLTEYYKAKEKLNLFYYLNEVKIEKLKIEDEHKRNINKINLEKDANIKERKLSQENYRYEEELAKIENRKKIEDITTQDLKEAQLKEIKYNEASNVYYNHLANIELLRNNFEKVKNASLDTYDKGDIVRAKKLRQQVLDEIDGKIKNEEAKTESFNNQRLAAEKEFNEARKVVNDAWQSEDEKQKQDEKNRAKLQDKELRKLTLKEQADGAKIELETTRQAQAVLRDDSKLQSAKKMELYDEEEKRILIYYGNLLKLADTANEKSQIDLDLKKDLDEVDVKRYNTLVNVNKETEKSISNLDAMAESLKGSGITQTYEESVDVLVKNKENRMQSIMGELDNLNRSSIVSEFLVRKKLNLIREAADTERDILFNKYRLEVAAAEKAGLDITEIEKKYAKEKEKITLNERDTKIKAVQDTAKKGVELAQYGMNIANELGALANAKDEALRDEQGKLDLEVQKRMFERNKNFQYANAIMNTAAAVTGALAASGGVNWPAAIAAGIAGAVQMAKIAATKFTPESGASTGGGGSTNITAPQMAEAPKNPFFSQGYMNQNIGPNGMVGFRPGKDNSMIKVGVYESDIRNVMNKVNVLETRSTLSGAGN
jgi:hypothetical protein